MYLRDPLKSRYLWIDTDCINQSHNMGKNHQVSKMRFIYQNAAQVVAWLAEAADGSEAAESIGAAIDYILKDKRNTGIADSLPGDIEMGIAKLFTKPYWKRVWVVQEIAVAKRRTFHYRHKRLSMDALVNYLSKKRLTDLEEEKSPISITKYFLRLVMRSDDDVYGYLSDSSQLQATRMVDKIYGLLGLFPESFCKELDPDYCKSYQGLMVDVVRACLAVYGRIDINTCLATNHRDSHAYGYPNWPRKQHTETKQNHTQREHNNTPKSRKTPEIHLSDTTLEATGFVVSRISQIVRVSLSGLPFLAGLDP